jgi:urease accessory protein
MIRFENMVRLGDNPLQRMARCDTTRLACYERNPGWGSAAHEGFSHAAYTRRTIVVPKGTHLSFQHEPTNSRKLMFQATSLPDLTADLGPFSSSEQHGGNPSDTDLQRADGAGRIVLIGSDNGTRVVDVFQQSPIRIMFPRSGDSPVEEAVLINTAGGIAGGDRLKCGVTALANASIAVTTQAAEKVYRALSEPARISTKLKACDAAKLAWLPQETIVFNWARVIRKTEIDLSSGAELLGLEWLVLGRAAHGEEMVGGHITESWRIKKDGRLIWADSFRVTDKMFPHVHRKALLSNYKAIGTLIYFGPSLDRRLEFLRVIAPSLECHCALTLVGGLIVVRFAANKSSVLKLALLSFLQRLSRELGPGPFRVPKMWSC